ncbi:MAG: hypothetical protein K0B87_07715 [Candidatus Syntrophosphaera sp.]|nr:hypothetical protein [Candidatus Syntrophosphaera sp.]
MFRILSDDKAESLFQVYLDSIRSSREQDLPSFPLPEKPSAAKGQRGREPEFTFSPDKLLGNVRLLDDGEYLVHFLVIGQAGRGLYTALKVSPFAYFQAKTDLEFAGYAGSYIAELDNSFHLNQDEIAASIILDDVDGYTFMQLESAWEARSGEIAHRFRLDKFDSWQARFHIQEHELTLSYRSRNTLTGLPPTLWIPHLEIGPEDRWTTVSRSHAPYRRERMNDEYNLVQFDRMPARKDKVEHVCEKCEQDMFAAIPVQMFEERDYSLEFGPGGSIVLLPHRRFIGRMVTIYCDEYKVFQGLLPKVLTVTDRPDSSLYKIEAGLKFRISTSG